jgi:mannan endo-1,4-beta-mannosidase
MGKRGMKAVLYLNNSWEWSGGYGFYLEHAGLGKAPRPNEAGYEAYMRHVAQFATSEKAQQLFYDYVRFILSRQNRYTSLLYKDDPTIMAWQIGNEPRAFGDKEKQPFARWLAESSALIRQLDSNHLISVGSEGIWGCEMDSALYVQICSDPNIDYLNAHVWPYNWSWVKKESLIADVPKACENTSDYLRPHFEIARQLRKPLVIEEFGFPRDGFSFSPSSTTKARDAYYRYIFSLVQSEPTVAGCNFWAWGGEARPQHEQWQVGDPYMGDPAQEQQGLNSVFNTDKTTLKLIPQ